MKEVKFRGYQLNWRARLSPKVKIYANHLNWSFFNRKYEFGCQTSASHWKIRFPKSIALQTFWSMGQNLPDSLEKKFGNIGWYFWQLFRNLFAVLVGIWWQNRLYSVATILSVIRDYSFLGCISLRQTLTWYPVTVLLLGFPYPLILS